MGNWRSQRRGRRSGRVFRAGRVSNGTGDAGSFFELPGAAVNGAFLDSGPNALISGRLNSTVNGRYVFEARSGTVIVPPMLAIPLPAPALIGGLGVPGLLRRNA